MQTKAVEDYLKNIYELQDRYGKVPTTVLAERLGKTPASITGMIKKLATMQLVSHESYQGVSLTESGAKVALEVIRHHRLIERYLAEALGVPWDKVHAEADQWEHVLSEDMEERIDRMLGYPTTDPHGAPIPRRDGSIPPVADTRLSDLRPGQSGVIAEVSDHDSELLRYLGGMGLYPGAAIKIVALAPFGGPVTLTIAGAQHTIGREAATHVRIHPA